jgi:transposase-like protein
VVDAPFEGEKPSKKTFKTYPIGFVHIDIAEVRTEEGKLFLFIAIDRTSKLAFARLVEKANTTAAVAFLNDLVEAVPYKIDVVLTDNGIQFAICRGTAKVQPQCCAAIRLIARAGVTESKIA